MGVLDGKVAVIAGGTSGIGAATAALFIEAGARVVIAGRRREEGEALAKKLGPWAGFFRTDVAEESDVKALIDHAVGKFGRLDCLFNNAGTPGGMYGVAEIDMERHYDATMNVHLRGVVLGVKHAAPVMIRQGSGSIINTGSIAAHRAGLSAHLYSTAKAAVVHFTRCAAAELAEKGVRVNSVSPGAIPTGIFGKGVGLADADADRIAESLKARFAEAQPLRRAGLSEDIAQAALFLASDASSFVTGIDIVVDGGNILGRPWSQTVANRDALKNTLRPPH